MASAKVRAGDPGARRPGICQVDAIQAEWSTGADKACWCSLLYNRRRTNPDCPGLSVLEFQTVMSFPREHLEFAIWFLRKKQYIRTGDNSDYSISSAGAEYLESEVPSNGVLSKLLHAPQCSAPSEPVKEKSYSTENPGYALALVGR